MAAVTLPAVLDALASSPLVSLASVQRVVNGYHQFVPFASLGFGWVVPAALGALVGLGAYLVTNHQNATVLD